MKDYDEIIRNYCDRNNIKVTCISNDWVYVLEKDNKTRYIIGYNFDLNSYACGRILDDKFAFYDLAKYKGYPIVPHHLIYKKEEIKEFLPEYNNNVVIKANHGTCGKEVFWAQSEERAEEFVDKLLVKSSSLSLCPYIDIKEEYRVIILDNNVEMIYGKIRPIVTGDGINTIKDLLIKFNPSYFTGRTDLSEEILSKGEKYIYNWQFNLSGGATIDLNIDEALKKEVTSLALKIAKEINIKFCSIDIIQDVNDNLLLMEANSGVMMKNLMNILPNGKDIARNIYEKAIKLMFLE